MIFYLYKINIVSFNCYLLIIGKHKQISHTIANTYTKLIALFYIALAKEFLDFSM